MRLGDRIVDGVFLERPNRYLAKIAIDGNETTAHVPDPGRLPGLMVSGRAVRLVYNPGPKRKTDYTLVLVRHGSIWVSVYPVFANSLVNEALANRGFPFFRGYSDFSAEVKNGNSRFDFRLDYESGPTYLEVKSVSCVEDGVGKFPDAPTERGVKHLQELIHLRGQGQGAAVLFVSQRPDTRRIVPNDDIDPKFGDWLRMAYDEGVQLFGYNCKVTPSSVALNKSVEVVFPD